MRTRHESRDRSLSPRRSGRHRTDEHFGSTLPARRFADRRQPAPRTRPGRPDRGHHESTPRLFGQYKHVVVIYQENHSFDNLYGELG